MNALTRLNPGVWYGPAGEYPGRGPFPSPQILFRTSYGWADYTYISEGPDNKNIRAAAVFPANEPVAHLIDSVPYCLIAYFDRRKMLIVSVDDTRAWLDRAINSNAEGWYVNTSRSITWHWSEPELDEHGLKIRPLSLGGPPPKHVRRKTDYDKNALIDDLRSNTISHTDLGIKYGVSRITIMKVAHAAGIRLKGFANG